MIPLETRLCVAFKNKQTDIRIAHGKSSLWSNVVLWRQGEQREPRGTWNILRDGGCFAQASFKGSSSLGGELIAEVAARFGDLHSHSHVTDFTSEK